MILNAPMLCDLDIRQCPGVSVAALKRMTEARLAWVAVGQEVGFAGEVLNFFSLTTRRIGVGKVEKGDRAWLEDVNCDVR